MLASSLTIPPRRPPSRRHASVPSRRGSVSWRRGHSVSSRRRSVAPRRPLVSWRRLARAAVALAAFAGLAESAGAAWRPPVPGTVARPFDLGPNPFEAGRHRGIDIAARPGATVRAPCAGPVAFAGAAGTSGRVVTLRCGRWRVSHMPLASIAVVAGEEVGEGARLGTVAASRDHAGLHLGVRREGTRFGYADPLRFLATGHPPPLPPLGRAPRPARPTPRSPRPSTTARPRVAPPRSRVVPRPSHDRRPALVPRSVVARRPAGAPGPTSAAAGSSPATSGSNPGGGPVAPWPVWLGLALVLAGAGVRLRGRPRRGRPPVGAAGTVAR